MFQGVLVYEAVGRFEAPFYFQVHNETARVSIRTNQLLTDTATRYEVSPDCLVFS